mgnify:CR=1 FL=1
MINPIVLASQLLAMSYLSTCNYVSISNIEKLEDVIETDKLSTKNLLGDYPWESMKIINGEIYYLYKGYFRTRSAISKSRIGKYVNNLSNKTGKGKYYLLNRKDNREIMYYNINDIVDILNSKIYKYERTVYRGKKLGRNFISWIWYLRFMELLSKNN